MNSLPKQKLVLPEISAGKVQHVYAQTLSYRKGGIRVDHQVINSKHIFHNYGHGGTGIALSFGSAYIVSKSLPNYFNIAHTTVQCAVLGAGINGLMTAIELLKRGRRVNIYADCIPQLNVKDNQKIIASQVCPIAWMPIDYDWSEDTLKHELLSKLSYDFLRESVDLKRFQSLRYMNVFDTSNKIEDLKDVVTDFIFDTFNNINLQYKENHVEEAVQYKTIHIDTPFFLEELRIEAILRGARFVEQHFNSLDDVLTLQQNAIFNCTGVSSEYLFDDKTIQKVKAHIIQLEEKNEHLQNFVLKTQKFQLQCFGKKTYLISYDKNKVVTNLKNIDKDFVSKTLKEVAQYSQAHKKVGAKL